MTFFIKIIIMLYNIKTYASIIIYVIAIYFIIYY